MFRRNIELRLREALGDTPVTLLSGARQVGKSTLAGQIAGTLSGEVASLDDLTVLAAASADPAGWLAGQSETLLVIDEVQKAPTLFPAIKASVDADRRPGRFLLTGSANVLLLPRLSESLAGRMEILSLSPLSQGEIHGRREHFVDAVLAAELPPLPHQRKDPPQHVQLLLAGGYPEALSRSAPRRRQAWFASYVTAILQRDVRDLANIEGITEMPRLLKLLAARIGGLLNTSELSRSSGLPNTTLKRYLSLLETTFLFQPLPAWSTNLGKRLTKSPKVHLVDAGLAAYLTGQTESRLAQEPTFLGQLLEGFVVSELRKQSAWSDTPIGLYHYRTTDGREVDLVLEDAEGRLVGIEVKAAATVSNKDFGGLRILAQDSGKRFLRGLVLYRGKQTVAFGKNLHAIPLEALWLL